jgi:hypothetical protein
MKKVRLNNFILWCKGWYESVNDEMDIITEARKILTLDDYLSCNNPISIALCYIDELVGKGVIKPMRLLVWNEEIVKYMSMYNVNYNEALLYRIRNFFAFECDKLPLNPPIYSRKLYKMGFVTPKHFGNSYKMANYKANKFFNKRNNGLNSI